jgi:hypothetical protein
VNRRVLLGLAVALSLICGACTMGSRTAGSTPNAPGSPPAGGPSSVPLGPRSTLCQYPKPVKHPQPIPPSPVPAAVEAVVQQVSQIRELAWVRGMAPEPVSQEQLGRILRDLTEHLLPAGQLARESRSWITIGALPPGSSLRDALLSYVSSEVVGFYDTLTQRLVYSATSALTPYARYVLSHELTHALDDQRFDLSREDALAYRCQDEPLAAFSALAEGDAVYTSGEWARRFLSSDEISRLQQEAAGFPPPPPSIPPFVQALQEFPYPNGLAFVHALVARGGEAAVDAAFRNPPVSTEQILHPDRYPSDLPVVVTVAKPDGLRNGWHLIDQMGVGEAWLKLLLELRLPESQAETAAAGWGGAEYEAWARGASTVVVLRTVWDSSRDASEFAAALRSFAGTRPVTMTLDGTAVTATFASDAASLASAGA